jgi:ComF family protein
MGYITCMLSNLRYLPQKAKPFATAALDALFPPQCLICRAIVPQQGTLCAGCWEGVSFITDPMCMRCGTPFPHPVGGRDALCGECSRALPPYTAARAVFRYDDMSKRLILPLKYHDTTHAVAIYGRWLARAGADYLQYAELVVPVPLHYWRLVKRRYNQSALLGAALSRATGIPTLQDGLLRVRNTPPQSELDHKDRHRNVKNAFAVAPRRAGMLRNKTVALVDDVFTTGATISACAETLLEEGAKSVIVVTLARTVKG